MPVQNSGAAFYVTIDFNDVTTATVADCPAFRWISYEKSKSIDIPTCIGCGALEYREVNLIGTVQCLCPKCEAMIKEALNECSELPEDA